MQTVKTNVKSTPAPTMVLQAADIARNVVQRAQAVRKAGVELIYASALYLLNVAHFATGEQAMTRAKAIEYLEGEVQKATDVKNRMLANYISPAAYLFDALTSSPKMFANVLEKIRTAKTIESGVDILAAFYEDKKGSRMESIQQFNHSTGQTKAAPRGNTRPTAESATRTVKAALAKVEKFVQPVKGSPVVSERQIAQTVVSTVSSKLTLLVEAIKAITQEAELDAAEQAIKAQRQRLRELSAKASANVKATAKELAKQSNGKVVRPARKSGKVQRTAA